MYKQYRSLKTLRGVKSANGTYLSPTKVKQRLHSHVRNYVAKVTTPGTSIPRV